MWNVNSSHIFLASIKEALESRDFVLSLFVLNISYMASLSPVLAVTLVSKHVWALQRRCNWSVSCLLPASGASCPSVLLLVLLQDPDSRSRCSLEVQVSPWDEAFLIGGGVQLVSSAASASQCGAPALLLRDGPAGSSSQTHECWRVWCSWMPSSAFPVLLPLTLPPTSPDQTP